jgi:glycosyltransferase involved in cell wall biosynthesis
VHPPTIDRLQRPRLRYAIITPVRNEAQNVRRLVEAVTSQTLQPAKWIIVDTGSTDRTLQDLDALISTHPWITVREFDLGQEAARGGPIAKAFESGLEAVPAECEIVVKLDADISMEPDHFDRLIQEFESDDRLGIAGGHAFEQDVHGVWRSRHGTGVGIWGASRAYRRACLDDILPLEGRMGWDTIDLVSANVRGWHTRSVDLPFQHHRNEGEREASRYSYWLKRGDAAYYMGYRPSYLLVRTTFRIFREPWAIALLYGYGAAALRRVPRCPDDSIRSYIRDEQRLRSLHLRAHEALRRRITLEDQSSDRSGV